VEALLANVLSMLAPALGAGVGVLVDALTIGLLPMRGRGAAVAPFGVVHVGRQRIPGDRHGADGMTWITSGEPRSGC
jgi:hypothetical protein